MPGDHERVAVAEFVDGLQSSGRYTFSFREAVEASGGSVIAARSALRRLKEKGRLTSPRREFFVVVPLEYRSTGSPPASWFIDDLMRYLEQPYYVGLLSAAAIHGASHQHPQVFQVVTSQPTPVMVSGRVRIAYFRKRSIERVATTRVKTDTGYMAVSTPEATVFDVIRHAPAAGHLSNVATVLSELAEAIDADKLAAAAAVASVPEVQRAGYLFELVEQDELASSLEAFLSTQRVRPVRLRPDVEAVGAPVQERWRLFINEDVEPDL